MKEITLRGRWLIRAPIKDVFAVMTDFEKFPDRFPKVAESIRIKNREGDLLEMEAVAKSFGGTFPVNMRTRVLPGNGFISDNESRVFGTSGHEEFLLSEHPDGTLVDYTYQVTIHKPWLRLLAGPLIRGYSMGYWEKAVIGELRKLLEKR